MCIRDRDCVLCQELNVTTANQQTVCVSRCGMDEYLNVSVYSCQPCNTQCMGGCVGPANTQCQQCKGATMTVGGGTTCLGSCPTGMYQSSSGTCMDCHEQCSVSGGCNGPTNRDCSGCKGNSVTSVNSTECVADCPFAHNFDTDANNCVLSK